MQDSPTEFESLRADVPCELDWCSQAFGQLLIGFKFHLLLPQTDRPPDAVNLWIGNSKSITSIHNGIHDITTHLDASSFSIDPYENIYHVVRGSKTFLLLPPTEAWCLRGWQQLDF